MLNRYLAAPAATVLAALATACGAWAAAPVSYGGDSLRTGWYPDQASLSRERVTGGDFGQLFSTAVDGQVYGQPLLSNGVLFVATETNQVYGLDPVTGAVEWHRDVGTPFNPADLSCDDLTPSVGVTGTPVIDPNTGTAYFFAKSYLSGNTGATVWRAHAVDVTTGAERPGFPLQISGTAQNNPLVSFDADHEMQRPGLLLMDGVVYAAFGGHCDRGYYKGWIVGVSTSGQTKAMWVALGGQNDRAGAGIWQSGGGIVSDGPGRLIVATGNGGSPVPPTPGASPPADLGESVVRLQVQPGGSLAAADFFAPYDAANLDDWDADLSSGGPVGLPSQYFGTRQKPNLLVQMGKQGYVYLLDRDHLGGIGQGPQGADDVVSRVGPYGGVWSRPAVWPGDGGYVYAPTASGTAFGHLRVYRYGTDGSGNPSLALAATSDDGYGFGSGSPVVTSDGTKSGSAIVWLVWAGSGTGAGAQLRAYDALPSGSTPQLLWSAPIGTSTKFTPPGVGNGRVYVGTRDGHVLGFGSPVDPPVTASSMSFPPTSVGSSSAPRTETLTATRPVTVTDITSTNPQFTVGAPSRSLPATLAPGDSIDVPVTFKPTAAGPVGATLKIGTSSSQVTAGLSGTGVAQGPKLSVAPPAVSFEGAVVGGHRGGTVTISNDGDAPLTIGSISTPGAPFSITNAPAAGYVVPSLGSVTIDAAFDPASAGSFTDSLAIHTDGGAATVGLSGTAAGPPRLEISPPALDFGAVLPGASPSASFSVRNAGESTLTIMKSKPPGGGRFVATSELAEGSTLAPGEVRTETVEFRPTDVGGASDAWVLTADDGSGEHDVSLTGAGAAPAYKSPPVQVSPPPADGNGGPFTPLKPPKVSGLRVVPAKARVGARRVAHLRLSRAAAVAFTVKRRLRCHARLPIGRCLRHVRAGRSWTVRLRAGGAVSIALPGRLGAGEYVLSAKPAAGKAVEAAFSVTAR